DIFGLGPLDGLCRVFPDFPLHKPGAMPQGGLAHQLGAVGPLDAHILMLVFINLPMHKAVGGPASGAAHPPDGAGLFWGLLFCQLVFGRLQLFPALFHAELRSGGLFLFAFLPELRLVDTLSRSALCPGTAWRAAPSGPGRSAAGIGGLLPGAGALPGLLFGFIRFSLHSSSPPGAWSAGYRSPHGGTDPQRGWSHHHRTAGPRRNWNG